MPAPLCRGESNDSENLSHLIKVTCNRWSSQQGFSDLTALSTFYRDRGQQLEGGFLSKRGAVRKQWVLRVPAGENAPAQQTEPAWDSLSMCETVETMETQPGQGQVA